MVKAKNNIAYRGDYKCCACRMRCFAYIFFIENSIVRSDYYFFVYFLYFWKCICFLQSLRNQPRTHPRSTTSKLMIYNTAFYASSGITSRIKELCKCVTCRVPQGSTLGPFLIFSSF